MANEAEDGSAFDELSERQKQKIMSNPEVRKMLEYSEKNIPQIAGQLNSLVPDEDEEDETFELFTQSVADRSGRVTQSTVKKVIRGMVEEGKRNQ